MRPFSLLAPDARYRVDEIKSAEVPPEVTKLTDKWSDEIRSKLTDQQLPKPPEIPEFKLPPNDTPFTDTALTASAILGPAALMSASTLYPAYRATQGVLNATPGDAPRYAIRGATDGLGSGVGGVLGGGAGFLAGDALAKGKLDSYSPLMGNSARILGLLAGAGLGSSAGKRVSRTVLPLSKRERDQDEEKQGQDKQAGLGPALSFLAGKAMPWLNRAKSVATTVKPYAGLAGRAAMGGAGGYMAGNGVDGGTGYGGIGGALAGAAANVMHHRGMGKLIDPGQSAGLSSKVREMGMRSLTGQGLGMVGDTALQTMGLEDPDSYRLSQLGALAGAGSTLLGRSRVADGAKPTMAQKFNRYLDEGPLGGGNLASQRAEFGNVAGTSRWLGTTLPGAGVAMGVPLGLGLAGNHINNKIDEKARSMADSASQQFASNMGMTPDQMKQMGGMASGLMNPIKSLAGGVMGQSNVPSFISQLTPAQQMAIMGGLGMGAYGAYTGNYGLGAAGAGLAAAPMAYNYMAGAQPDYRRMSQTANPQQAGTY